MTRENGVLEVGLVILDLHLPAIKGVTKGKQNWVYSTFFRRYYLD